MRRRKYTRLWDWNFWESILGKTQLRIKLYNDRCIQRLYSVQLDHARRLKKYAACRKKRMFWMTDELKSLFTNDPLIWVFLNLHQLPALAIKLASHRISLLSSTLHFSQAQERERGRRHINQRLNFRHSSCRWRAPKIKQTNVRYLSHNPREIISFDNHQVAAKDSRYRSHKCAG